MESRRDARWYLVGLLAAIAALNYADRAALSAVLSPIRDEMAASPAMLGAIGSAFLWAYALCSPVSGYLADRWPRARIIVASLTAWSVATLLTGFARTPGDLLVARALLGVAECAYVPAAVGLTAEYHPGTTRARAIGIQLAGYNLGVILGGVFAGYAADRWGWRYAFWVLGAAGLVVAAVVQRTLPRGGVAASRATRSDSMTPGAALRTLFAVPTFVIVLLESTCIAASAWIFLVWLPLYFREAFSLSLTAAGLAGTMGLQTASLIASLAGGFLSDRFAGSRRERRMLFQFFCYAAATPLLAVFFGRPSFAAASTVILLFALFRSLGSSNDHVILCDVLPPPVRSSAIGIANALNSAAGGIAVLVTGYVQQDFGLSGVFASMCVTVGCAAFLSMLGYRRYLGKDLAAAGATRD